MKQQRKNSRLLPGEKLVKRYKTTEDPSSHRKCGEGWFRRVTSSDTKESSSQFADVIITGLESGQSSSGAQVCVSSSNVAKALHAGHRKKYIQEHEKAEVVTFLDAHAFYYYQELPQAYKQQMFEKAALRSFRKSSKW